MRLPGVICRNISTHQFTIRFVRAKRGGYSEAQVDLVIDGLIETMLAVR